MEYCAVAYMHSQSPPVIHRDLKVENVLLDEETGIYKLCDFGSAIVGVVHLNNKSDMTVAEEDIAKHTTPQYRPPEMIDLYRSKVINEKVDIWALGCLLYKLLFYTTPFEEAGSLGILNGNYQIPTPTSYSNEMISLIRYMLHPEVDTRPDIYYITNEVCRLRGIPQIFPGKGQQYHNNPYTSPNLSSSISNNNSNNSNNNNNSNFSTSSTVTNNNNSSNINGGGIGHSMSSKPPKPPIQQQQQQPTFDGFEQMEDDEFSNPNIALDQTSPHIRRKSPSAPMQPIIIQQQPQLSSAAAKRRPVGGSTSKPNTPATTPSMAPLAIPNTSKLESPLAFNLEPSSVKSYEIEEITSLVAIATNSDPIFDMESFSKLKSISLNYNLTPGNGIMSEVVKRPLREPAVCLKSLLLVHKLMVEGNQTFKIDAYDSKDLFNNLYLGWLKQKEKCMSNTSQQHQHQQQQQQTISTTINPFVSDSNNNSNNSAEPTFNPFSNSTDSMDPFSSASVSPAQSPRNSLYLQPQQQQQQPQSNTSLSLPQSPVMSRKMVAQPNNNNQPMIGGGPPLRFPHSASLDDARLYTLILTPSPSPPVSPSFNRSSNNIPVSGFDQLSINPFQLQQQQQQQQQQPHLLHPQSHHQQQSHHLHPQQHSQQQQQQQQQSSGNPFDAVPFYPQHLPTALQKSAGSLMPPPKAPVQRGHRRSQSSTTDDMRRRQLLQQQLEQNKEFQMNQRKQRSMMHSSSSEVVTNTQEEMFGDDFDDDFDESSSIMTRKR
ncbi:putative protein serine/threonine kinase [Heterostelium album PN500]|uniref:Protein kinase domain-containing protein n=1 Tax=Heterostelium pallidum (strain ATCC 26659 / Pp 5 / PN500) TaxID=670386 RepID=D3BHA4_HETP5|nr:putative protein serine/threonine kinase [Heterostelium album PN500]EFA79081.1 putative protein serine/threonine kinase [Heterostelium album PN500]|eukprot:XP_020431203.1 putative protein serine/threonine kinase [Heterostelium album PN500]